MRGDFHVRFCERFGLKCPDLLDLELYIFIINHLHNSKIMRTFEPKMLADRHRTTADSF